MNTRIILADDHIILREGLKKIIEHELRLSVIAQASNGREAIELVREHIPDIVIIDIGMPGLNGIEATRTITKEFPHTKVIALSMHTERNIVAEMLSAGASAYLLKDTAPDELGRAIALVLQHKKYISPDITGVIIDDYVQKLDDARTMKSPELTPKEREVLQLLTEGKTTKEIGSIMFVSPTTVETHKQHIMEKLNLHSIAELTKYAIREGITSL